jgi:hypothetical protein
MGGSWRAISESCTSIDGAVLTQWCSALIPAWQCLALRTRLLERCVTMLCWHSKRVRVGNGAEPAH